LQGKDYFERIEVWFEHADAQKPRENYRFVNRTGRNTHQE